MKSWHPPLILLALILPATLGFAAGGPGFGFMLAGFSLVGLVIIVLRLTPNDPIGRRPHPELDRKLLIVSTFPIEDAPTIQRITDLIGLGGVEPETAIRILTTADNTFLRRWATDLKAARERAQGELVISVASLTLAGVDADARVGDEDLVQAVEDELRTYDATEVFLLTRGTEAPDVDTLRERLQPDFTHLDLSRGAETVPGGATHPDRFSR